MKRIGGTSRLAVGAVYALGLTGLGLIGSGRVGPAGAAVTPAAVTVTAGSSASTSVTVDVPAGEIAPVPAALDVEIAIDTTGSMATGIAQATADAEALAVGVQAVVPGARFAVVQFRDTGDVPDYNVEQPMTDYPADIRNALGSLVAGGGGDSPEAHSLVFHNAATDPGNAIGWAPGAKRIVVVLSDAEPHGAGITPPRAGTADQVGIPGCVDATVDPFKLDVRTSLGEMAAAGESLYMVLEPGAISATPNCYELLALTVGGGSRGLQGGASLAGQLVPLITGSSASSAAQVTAAVTAVTPGATAAWVTPSVVGPVARPSAVTVPLKVTVPPATPAGTYTFDLVGLADGLAVGAPQALAVTVTAPVPVPVKGGGGGGGGGGGVKLPSVGGLCSGSVPPLGAIVGTDGDDVIVGTDGNDVIWGMDGNDKIDGGAGVDTICGGGGDDLLFGGLGDDKLSGDAGNDDVYGGDGADQVKGGDGSDRVYGGAGSDKVAGGLGDDAIDGGDGSDDCRGDGGANTFTLCEKVAP